MSLRGQRPWRPVSVEPAGAPCLAREIMGRPLRA
jgi:hypothetical protein